MPLPTFIIPGAPKADTTSLWGYLNEHPRVCMARIKEPHFFARYRGELEEGIPRPGAKRFVHFKKGIEWYEGLYASCGNALARGGASTEYFSAPDSAELINEWVPGVKQQTLPRFRGLQKLINRFRYSNLAKKIPDPHGSIWENSENLWGGRQWLPTATVPCQAISVRN